MAQRIGVDVGGTFTDFVVCEDNGREVKGKETIPLRAGDVVTIQTSGGGGYGSPAARASELIERDHREGYR